MLRKDSEETHLPTVLNALEHIVLGTDDSGPEPKDSKSELAGITD